MELFTLDPGLAIWTWIAFGILFLILWKFVFPALLDNIKNREHLIAQSVDDATEIQKRLERINTEHAGILKKARKEADDILRNTRKEAEVLKKKLLEKAELETEEIIAQAREKIAAEREALLQSLQEELADFVCDTSERIIGTSFTSEKDREWARELAKTL